MMTTIAFTWAIAILLCTAAALTDLRSGSIPNYLTLPGICLGLALGFFNREVNGRILALVGALVTALVPLLLFRFRAMGGGDVKLFAAIGALVGAGTGLEIQMAAFAIGALQGMTMWLLRGQLRQGLAQVARLAIPNIFRRQHLDAGAIAVKRTEIRLGPAIMLATVLVIVCRILG